MSQGSPPRMKIAGYFQQSIRPFAAHMTRVAMVLAKRV
jgi:hypothetical protein